MKREAVEDLVGMKVSVMLNKMKPDGVTCESYIGYLERVGDSFIELDYKRASYKKDHNLSRIIVDLSIVDSVWVFDKD